MDVFMEPKPDVDIRIQLAVFLLKKELDECYIKCKPLSRILLRIKWAGEHDHHLTHLSLTILLELLLVV